MIIDLNPRNLWGTVVFTHLRKGLVAIEAIMAALATDSPEGMRTAADIAGNSRFPHSLRCEAFHTTSYHGHWPDDNPERLRGRFVEVVMNGDDRLLSVHAADIKELIGNGRQKRK